MTNPTVESTEMKKKPRSKNKKPEKPLSREILEWVLTIVVAVLVAFGVRTFLVEPVRVDGASMNDTLANNEIMLVTKYDYLAGQPQRFDVIICHYPGRNSPGLLGIQGPTNFVKRIVGLPGDTVELREGYLYVNGERYEEPYVSDAYRRSGIAYSFGPVTVPEGQYFVMGDHRNNSNDSRNLRDVGPVDRSMIVGHVQLVLFPFSNFRTVPNGLDVK